MRKIIQNTGLLFLLTALLNSCAVVGGIFKAGVWTGILIVVGIIVLIVVVITRSRK